MSSPRVSSEHDQDSEAPARLSALYQYHNAPEVAPAHGLEYDDTIYPVSDKFPVVREMKFGHRRYSGKHGFSSESTKPPRIIFGMKVKTFLLVATVMVLVIVGAAVGGAVGGKNLHSGEPAPSSFGDTTGNSTSSSPSPTTSATTYHAPTPTYTPISACSASDDNTTYTSQYSKSSGAAADDAGLVFIMHCNTQSPLSSSAAQQLGRAFVYSFSDCAEVCAGYNFLNADSNCTFAAYKPEAPRPVNCWVGSSQNSSADSLGSQHGTEVALLRSQY